MLKFLDRAFSVTFRPPIQPVARWPGYRRIFQGVGLLSMMDYDDQIQGTGTCELLFLVPWQP